MLSVANIGDVKRCDTITYHYIYLSLGRYNWKYIRYIENRNKYGKANTFLKEREKEREKEKDSNQINPFDYINI